MSVQHCELCGRELEPGGFYVVRVEVFADPKMPGVSGEELHAIDFDAEMDRLLEQMKGMSAEELQDQIHRRFEYKICPSCQPGVLANPLGKPRIVKVGEN
jgi:hypothetical protein